MIGSTRSGKTTRLLREFERLAASTPAAIQPDVAKPMLVFAAIGDNRIALADRLLEAQQRDYPFVTATPLGFFQDEVVLFYPLLVEELGLTAQFPLRLRPETEQELATRLWREELDDGRLAIAGVPEYFVVRRVLDLVQLAGSAGIAIEDLPTILQEGLGQPEETPALWETMGAAMVRWRQWCLDRGLLTYGLVAELYWRYLLPHLVYRQQLGQRYRAVLADDVDEYPAIAQSLFAFLLDQGIAGVFTYNPDGSVRRGLGADPLALEALSQRCRVEMLPFPTNTLGTEWADSLVQWVQEPVLVPPLPEVIHTIQTVSRADLLRQTAEVIIQAVQTNEIEPGDVAIVGPGLDAIARYTLREILSRQGVTVEALNDQQPLNGYPRVRSLLTLLALVYPGQGRLLTHEAIAELLVILSQPAIAAPVDSPRTSDIDPVRAGLLVDHCFAPDPDRPRLLDATAFPRWDRLGYQAAQAYDRIRLWIEAQIQQQQQRLIPSPVNLLDRAIQQFLVGGSHLPYDQLTALRELMETAQHYWEVDTRLRQAETPRSKATEVAIATSVGNFIQLLRSGTITADPYPVRPVSQRQAVTLATAYQYRVNRCVHRWQFWLDAGSPLWLTGGGALFGAPLLLSEWSGQPWTTADAIAFDQERLGRQVRDLLYRAGVDGAGRSPRIYLCHSDLAISGQEQTGPLLTLVNAAIAQSSY
ncbi:recombinase family protein [Leptolyngbya sp. AN02str]|uniref:recombinase family protein n=1 Tax=Leptolyngbya sp. AN02str TaxID=3423363 RepID=UPI003D319D1B